MFKKYATYFASFTLLLMARRGEVVMMAAESVAMLGAPLIGLTRLQCHQH